MGFEKDKNIISELYELYEQKMYYAAFSILKDEYLAEDAVHESFIRLIRNREKLGKADSQTVRGYVKKTVKSAALDIYRKRQKYSERCSEFSEADSIGYFELFEDPRFSLDELPPKYSSVIRCLYLHGLNTKETSAVLKISEALVRKRAERAKMLILKQLDH